MENRFKFNAWIPQDNIMIRNIQGGNLKYGQFYEILEIPNVEILQCTGLSDKNGKLIFEGDILEFNNGDRVIIKCEDDYIYFYCDPIGDPELEDQWRDLYRISDAKIIGNIYQYPELIK